MSADNLPINDILRSLFYVSQWEVNCSISECCVITLVLGVRAMTAVVESIVTSISSMV